MVFEFDEFSLDTQRRELTRQGQPLAVEPQVFEVLCHLVRHRDRVVGREELLDEVWQDRFVADSTLSHRVMEARRAVGDDGKSQRVIRTVHGRGFRFVAAVREGTAAVAPSGHHRSPLARENELAGLLQALAEAQAGRRQTVFVTGEAGLGKTTLVEAFLAGSEVRSVVGECLDHCGHPEPYLPVLDALGRLCRGPQAAEVVQLLARTAPTWLAQLPGLVTSEELADLQRRTIGASRDRMLREMGETLEALTRDAPLVLVLEDLHWSDPSTLDLMSWVARRKGFARLLLVGTFRPSDTAVAGHPAGSIARELVARGQAVEVPLSRLQEMAARALLAERGCSRLEAARILVRRTAGNPLFMLCLLEAWQSRGLLAEADPERLESEVPDSVCDLIERQLGLLPPEDRTALEAASVLRSEFSAAAAAVAAGLPDEQLEQSCHRLARRGAFLAFRGEECWPDGTVTTRFSFLHDLYREVLYSWLPAGRRARMHARVAARLESAWKERAAEQAAVLAYHFERGKAVDRAASYLGLAAGQALQRNAALEADLLLEAALELATELPSGETRDRLELNLQLRRSSARIAARGWSDPGAEECYLRALELCRRWDAPELSPVLYGLATLYEMRGEYARCQEVLQERMDREADGADSHELMACSAFHQGDFSRALEHADRGAQLYDPQRHLDLPMAAYGDNPAVSCEAWGALALALLGEPDRALERIEKAVSLARDPDHRFSLPLALVQAAAVHQLIDQPEPALKRAEQAGQAADEQGFPHHRASAQVLAGWAVARLGEPKAGLARLDDGLQAYRSSGACIDLPYFLTLRAQCAMAAGLAAEARQNLEEALSFGGEGRGLNVEAEILRLLGDLAEDDPGPLYRRALETARQQGARCLEQRIARFL